MGAGRIAEALRAARGRGRAAFIPYITAGDPSLEWTGRYLDVLTGAGADVVELGVPFSDPIADGPVIQRAAERSLSAGTTLAKILDLMGERRSAGLRVPVVLFTYYNPVLRMGLKDFADRVFRAGIDGVLTVDLPPEEAADYRNALAWAGVDAAFLAAPTTTDERLRLIDEASTAFVYYVSRLGVTGAADRALPRGNAASTRCRGAACDLDPLAEALKRVRKHVRKPVAVGFGIASPEAARSVSKHADAVVVGSALVALVAAHPPEEAERRMAELAAGIVAALGRDSAGED